MRRRGPMVYILNMPQGHEPAGYETVGDQRRVHTRPCLCMKLTVAPMPHRGLIPGSATLAQQTRRPGGVSWHRDSSVEASSCSRTLVSDLG